jgi:hypothetical protein
MKQRVTAVVLCVALASAACASARPGDPIVTNPVEATGVDPALMASYLRQLPIGSRVRVTLGDGKVVHGTLMKADGDPLVVQRRTRLPETPLQIQIKNVRAVELEKAGSGPGRAIAIGAAAGAGATLGVLLILAAVFAD